MTHAYRKTYLYNATRNFGNMMDYAINDCDIDGCLFLQMFITSGLAHQFEHGNPKVIAGMSGVDLATEAIGLSQSKLADEAGVSLRSIQMYEQRNKDINKAQALTVVKIARALGCEVEDLLE